MNYLFENRQKIDDILFANRNKAYGAYVIRSTYGHTILKSLAIMGSGIAAILLTLYYSMNTPAVVETITQIVPPYKSTEVILTTKKNETKKNAEIVKPNRPAYGTKSNAVAPHIDSSSVNTNTVLNEKLSAGTQSVNGTETIGPVTTGTGNGIGTATTSGGDSGEPRVAADSDPEFEGGLKGLFEYLSGNLIYPREASDLGKGGKITVRFVVDEKGKVTQPEILNKLGYGMEEEALRVVSGIPDFKKPAFYKGKPTKVYFNLPIRFNLK